MTLLKYENSKLKQQFIFNLPVSHEICGRLCPNCYALKAQIRFPDRVVPYREARHKASLADNFADLIIAELSSTRRSARTVRVHESGEWYSQAYIDKWHTIASALPNFTFYAFTKRLKHFDFTALMSLPNFVLIDSLMHGPLNYSKTKSPSVFTCPATLKQPVVCGVSCRYCMSKKAQQNGIHFIQH